jgi:hypothetical protein
MRRISRWVGVAALAAATTGAVLAGGIGAASAAEQGPHHHPTWLGDNTTQDPNVTVYREHTTASQDRWCVTNYHSVGQLRDYFVTYSQTKLGNGSIPFPSGGGHTNCTPYVVQTSPYDHYHVTVGYQSIATGRTYGWAGEVDG